MKKIVICLLAVLLMAMPVCAQDANVTGAWQLSYVAENGTVLEAEGNASLYAEKDNLCALYTDGSASLTITDALERFTQKGTWTQDGENVKVVIEEDNVTDFVFDAEKAVLHRIVKEDSRELDFVYTRVPAGIWQLTTVYSDGEALDPENAASLYSERDSVYFLFADWSAAVDQIEAGEIAATLEGSWSGENGTFHLDVEGAENDWTFDAEKDELHRSWVSDNADDTYKNLDFVYTQIPVGAWQLKEVFSTEPGGEPVLLDPNEAASLYAESDNVYYFYVEGTASVTEPEGAETSGSWTASADGITLKEGDDPEMLFTYDPAADLLHRSWKDDDPAATYKDLDFVYYPYGN